MTGHYWLSLSVLIAHLRRCHLQNTHVWTGVENGLRHSPQKVQVSIATLWGMHSVIQDDVFSTMTPLRYIEALLKPRSSLVHQPHPGMNPAALLQTCKELKHQHGALCRNAPKGRAQPLAKTRKPSAAVEVQVLFTFQLEQTRSNLWYSHLLAKSGELLPMS